MYTLAQVDRLLPVLIGTNSEHYGTGLDFRLSGFVVPASTAWSAINLAMYMPLYIDRPGIVTKFWAFNGATAAGNVDIGLYDVNYVRLVSTGSTAQAGTSVIQEFDVTDFGIVPGVYFLGVAASLTTTTFSMISPGIAGYLRAYGITAQATALPLPNPAVPATTTAVAFPVAGIAFRTLVA